MGKVQRKHAAKKAHQRSIAHWAAAVPSNGAAVAFYSEVMKILKEIRVPFMVGGTFATNAYVTLRRPTKDLDIFCKASDYPKILHAFSSRGYETSVEDERWLAKVMKGKCYFDVVFNAGNAITPVTDVWFEAARRAKIYGIPVKVLGPTELILSKVFIQDRTRYDGSDVAHIILMQSDAIDWRRLLSYLDQYWEVLLMHVLNFRFIYPSEREKIPRWLMNELFSRLQRQLNLPTSQTKVCRGRLFSRGDYTIDINEMGFADLIGEQNERSK